MINYSKLERGKVNNYHLGYTNKFLQEDSFELVQKEILNFCNSVFTSNSLESWNEVRHADENIGKKKHFVFGGGYEGDTIEKFHKLIKENKLFYFSSLLEAFHTENFTDYIFKNLNLGLSYKPFRLVSKDFKQGLFGLREQPVFMNFKLSVCKNYDPTKTKAYNNNKVAYGWEVQDLSWNRNKLVKLTTQCGISGNEFITGHKTKDNWKVFSITPLKPYNYFDFN